MRYISVTVCMTVGLLLLSSCSGSEEANEGTKSLSNTYVCPSPSDYTPVMYSVSSKADTILGRGYDVMGNFLAATNLKESVIVVPDSEIIRMGYLKSDAAAYVGSDANDYLQDIMYTNGFSEKESSTERKLFTGSIKDYYDKNPLEFSSAHQFAGKDVFFTKTIMKLPVSVPLHYMKYISKYLTRQFKNDLNTLTPYQLVLKYGTHVLCNAFVGMRIHGITNCVVSDYKKDVARDAFSALCGRMDRSIGFTNLDVYSKDLEAHCSGGTLHIDFNGGDVNKVKYKNTTTATADYNGWWNSEDIDNDHFALTELHHDDLVPLYEFIADAAKQAGVKQAIEQYIADNQIKEVEMLPLLQVFTGNYHRYYNSYDGAYKILTTNTSDSFECKSPLGLIYQNDKLGTKPLYRYTNGQNDRLSTSETIQNAGDYHQVGFLGYVDDKPVSSERHIAVYEIWDGSQDYAYTTENLESYGSGGAWKKTGNVFYIFKQ